VKQSTTMAQRKRKPESKRMNRLMDEVYRQMFRLEDRRPGAEMGLALALLRSWIAADSVPGKRRDRAWLATLGPICLGMIERSLDGGRTAAARLLESCDSKPMS